MAGNVQFLDLTPSLDLVDEISNNIKYANEDIAVFLKYADLEKYRDVFETSGLRKIDHLEDVQEEDLHKFGKITI